MSIIFADDDQFIRNIAGTVLKTLDPGVIVCENGQQAIDAFKANSGCKLIILDLSMPVMDGYEACKQLRAAGCSQNILALSGGMSTFKPKF